MLMLHRVDFLWYRFRYALWALFVVLCLPLFSLLPPVSKQVVASLQTQPTASKTSTTNAALAYDSPNVVSAGMAEGLTSLGQYLAVFADNLGYALRKLAVLTYQGLRHVGQVTAAGGKVVAKTIGSAVVFVANVLVDGVVFVPRVVGNAFGLLTKVPAVSAYVRPAEDAQTPTIDVTSAVSTSWRELTEAPTATEKAETEDPAPVDTSWPIRGQVTTLYGVPHWPFQPTHTGMDISSGQVSGVVAITPFRAGRVIEIVHSGSGLGNHVVVDHGNGLTSVYAHLASIATEVGREVDTRTVLGYEGSTGASTGTHLHFEIRQNGQPVNPQQYFDVLP